MIAGVGLLLAAAAAPVSAEGPPNPPAIWPGGCAVTAKVDGEWGSGPTGGQVLRVTVRNNATVTTKKWTVRWTIRADQRIVHWWNAVINTSGSAVTATHLAYNGVLAPGAATDFGVLLSGTAPAPTMSCSSDNSQGRTLTLTEAHNGGTFYVAPGDAVAVSLRPDYRPLTLTGSALTQVSTSGGYPTGMPLSATYLAGGFGSTELTTGTDYECLHATPPCAVPQKQWKVRVFIAAPYPAAEG